MILLPMTVREKVSSVLGEMGDGDLLTLHDVVSIGDKTNGDGRGEDSQLPDIDGGGGLGGITGGPGTIDDSPGTDGVSNIVGAVSEGCSASSEDLDERIGVLNFVGVLLSVCIDARHAFALGSTSNTTLSGVDVVVHTVQGTTDDVCRDALEEDLHVCNFINLTGSHGVVAASPQSPAEGATAVDVL